MEAINSFFLEISSTERALILALGISFFWLLEGIIPFRILSYNKFKHAITNILLTLTTILINFSLAFLIVKTSDFVYINKFGMFSYFGIDGITRFIITIFILDLVGAYFAHLFQHKISFLWPIHAVHHSDESVDTTTANRHHPFESVVRFIFTFIGIFISGAPIGLVLMYQSISVIASQFNHANIQISNKVDKLLSYVIVSPNMHKVHHHFELPYTDSNYGNIFSIWDRLFGTYMELNKDKIVYGVDTDLDEVQNSKFASLIERPFKKWFNHFN